MEVAIRKMGNSQGVLILKPLLAQLGLEGTVDLQVRDGVIEIRPIRRNPREGWEQDAQRLAVREELMPPLMISTRPSGRLAIDTGTSGSVRRGDHLACAGAATARRRFVPSLPRVVVVVPASWLSPPPHDTNTQAAATTSTLLRIRLDAGFMRLSALGGPSHPLGTKQSVTDRRSGSQKRERVSCPRTRGVIEEGIPECGRSGAWEFQRPVESPSQPWV